MPFANYKALQKYYCCCSFYYHLKKSVFLHQINKFKFTQKEIIPVRYMLGLSSRILNFSSTGQAHTSNCLFCIKLICVTHTVRSLCLMRMFKTPLSILENRISEAVAFFSGPKCIFSFFKERLYSQKYQPITASLKDSLLFIVPGLY